MAEDGQKGLALKLKAVKEDPEDFSAKPIKISFWYKSTCSLRFGIIMSEDPSFSQ